MSNDWTSPEGRAELRRRFSPAGWYEPAIEAGREATIPLLDALEAAEAREAKLRKGLGLPVPHPCSYHPIVDARYAWGCPTCLDELRSERDEARAALREAMPTLRTFRCQHDPSCSEVNRGGCCNSCWARSWAESVRLP